MRKPVILILILFLCVQTYAQPLNISSDFESGSAKVLAIDAESQTIRISPAGDPKRGMPNWWYLKIEGIDIKKPLFVEIEPREDLLPNEVTGQEQKIAPAWSWPLQAAISYDNQTWKQTEPGYKQNKIMVYRIQPTSKALWLAWGPPFTASNAAAFAQNIARENSSAKTFTLCRSLEGREVIALHICEGDKPIAMRPAVWVDARNHAWECGSSWVSVGFAEWMVSDNEQAKWLRQNAEIFIVPVMDADHVATGDGGKLSQPRDHNLDWNDKPHWNEVAASQKYISALAKENRMSIFLDLHNPASGNKEQTAYVIEKKYMPVNAESRKLRFVELLIEEFGVLKQNPASPPAENPEVFHRVSVPWVLEHSNNNTIAFCIETPWNSPAGTTEGYRIAGQKLGRAVEKLLKEEY